MPKDDKRPDPLFLLINLDFLLLQTEQIDLNINLSFLVLKTLLFFTDYTISFHVYKLKIKKNIQQG